MLGHSVCQRSAGPVVVDTGQRLVNADNTVRSVLADEPCNEAGLRLGKCSASESVAIKTIGC